MSNVPDQAAKASADWSRLLPDKVVFITGAAGGIGSAIVKKCLLHGARVVIADVNKDAAEKLMKDLVEEDSTKKDFLLSIELDVADEKAIEDAVKTVVEKWKTIDILVNNAAIFTMGPVEKVSADDWTNVFNVNVRGYALMAKHIVPLLKKQRSGSIIQMASISSWIAQSEFVPYSTTKGAVLQMTRNMALDLGPFNVRCNAICPGTILTSATEKHAKNLNVTMEQFVQEEVKHQCLKRFGSPDEIANLTVFLASDLCHFATGASFVADGGYTTI